MQGVRSREARVALIHCPGAGSQTLSLGVSALNQTRENTCHPHSHQTNREGLRKKKYVGSLAERLAELLVTNVPHGLYLHPHTHTH